MKRLSIPLLLFASVLFRCTNNNDADVNSSTSHQEISDSMTSQDGDAKPLELISRAIEAYGGDSAREKLGCCKITTRWVAPFIAAHSETEPNTGVIEDSFSHPDKWRRVVRRESDGKETMLFVINGDNYWTRIPGKNVQRMLNPGSKMRKPAMLSTLDRLVCLRDSNEEFVVGLKEKIGEDTLVPLSIMVNGHSRSITYFSQSTGLIAYELKYYLPDMYASPDTWVKNGPAKGKTTYSDYKSFDGVVLPTHMNVSQHGKTVFDVSIIQVEFPSKFDVHTFEKPRDK